MITDGEKEFLILCPADNLLKQAFKCMTCRFLYRYHHPKDGTFTDIECRPINNRALVKVTAIHSDELLDWKSPYENLIFRRRVNDKTRRH